MQDNFDACVEIVLKNEGAYSNNPHDPGRATNFGIDEYEAASLGIKDVRKITREQAEEIYKKHYWDAVNCDALPIGFDLAVFDFAVNSGVSEARFALKHCRHEIDDLCDFRMSFLKRLSSWHYFGTGWSRRIALVRSAAHRMVFEAGLAKTEQTE